ncbi:MAG: hypothetical protein WBP72_04850 [Rhodocyclaceae bacterium]
MIQQFPDGAGTAAQDHRLSFDDAIAYVSSGRGAAFAVTPVFDEDHELAAGARVFLLAPEGDGDYSLRFIAGPFFSTAYAANEKLTPAEVPERVRELRFMPTRFDDDWLSDQVQLLIQKLMQASGEATPHMPDYQGASAKHAAADVVFPIAFIGKGHSGKH